MERLSSLKGICDGKHVDLFVSIDIEEIDWYLKDSENLSVGISRGFGFVRGMFEDGTLMIGEGYMYRHGKKGVRVDTRDIPLDEDEKLKAKIGFSPMAQIRVYGNGERVDSFLVEEIVRMSKGDDLNVAVLNERHNKTYAAVSSSF